MSDANRLTGWIDGYVRAWDTNDPRDIGDLFTDDAVYYTAPFRPPWRGRDEIVQKWLSRKDEAGTWSFEWHPLIVTDDLAIIEGETVYPDRRYSNLWVLRLDNLGQARQFTEWWMDQSKKS